MLNQTRINSLKNNGKKKKKKKKKKKSISWAGDSVNWLNASFFLPAEFMFGRILKWFRAKPIKK